MASWPDQNPMPIAKPGGHRAGLKPIRIYSDVPWGRPDGVKIRTQAAGGQVGSSPACVVFWMQVGNETMPPFMCNYKSKLTIIFITTGYTPKARLPPEAGLYNIPPTCKETRERFQDPSSLKESTILRPWPWASHCLPSEPQRLWWWNQCGTGSNSPVSWTHCVLIFLWKVQVELLVINILSSILLHLLRTQYSQMIKHADCMTINPTFTANPLLISVGH